MRRLRLILALEDLFAIVLPRLLNEGSNLPVEEVPDWNELRFQDLRDTFVTESFEAGCTEAEVCAWTGHSLESAKRIWKHYLKFTGRMADNAARKRAQTEFW